MADAEAKEKAEKVAAARKRYEQIKKQKAKDGKKGGKKSKDLKADDVDLPATDSAAGSEEQVKDEAKAEEQQGDEDAAAAAEDKDEVEAPEPEDDPIDEPSEPAGEAQPSLSLQSIFRNDSFRRSPSGTPLISPGAAGLRSPTTADGESAQDLFRKQVARIEQLEKENKKLEKELDSRAKALRKSEGDFEDLQEAHGDVAELKAKAAKAESTQSEMEKLRTEVHTLQRQNSHLQSQAASSRKRTPSFTASSPPPENLSAQLATKTSTIESLELEVSNLRHSFTTQKADLESKIRSLENSLQSAEEATTNAQTQLSELKATIDAPKPESGERSQKEAENRIILLESDLGASQRSASDAQKRAESLEKKVETLNMLHKESDARAQQQNATKARELDKSKAEASDLRRRLGAISNENARLRERKAKEDRSGVEGDGGGVEDIEEEERNRLEARVRELEAEVFELRRGAWRERRRELGDEAMGDDEAVASPNGFDDVDLSAPISPWGNSRRQSSPYGAFSNVINAFTGGGGNSRMTPRRQSSKGVQQALSPGGLEEFDDDDDDMFDEDAFRKAKEEQEKARLERVREIKRGLTDWKGWRVDLVESRGGAMAGVFDV